MRLNARLWTFIGLSGLIAFVTGLSVGISYRGQIQWNNQLGWQPIATLLGAVLNCVTVGIVAWAITTRLQERQSDKAFERGLLTDFVRVALASAARIHEFVLDFRKRSVFTEEDRQALVVLFMALGQDIQLIHDTLEALTIRAPSVESAQECRGQYKDLLTDQTPGEPLGQDRERAAYVKYREMRNHLVQIILESGRR
jgi:hypothetical protein